MKRRGLLSLIAVMCAFSVLLSGCGNSPEVIAERYEPESDETVADESDPSKESDEAAPEDNAGENGSLETADAEAEVAEESVNPADYMKAYQSFLKNKQSMIFDSFGKDGELSAPRWVYDEMYDYLKTGEEFSFSELTEALCRGYAASFDLKRVVPARIYYSYVDCGNDGIPELALMFEGVGNDSMNNDYILILKLIDDALVCTFQGQFGYRSYASLNEYGYYWYGGSNGASSHSVKYYYIDEQGKTNFLYGVNDEMSAYSLYIPGNEKYIEVAEDEGIADRVEIEQYYFEEYDDTTGYVDYVKNCDYVYYPLSGNYNRLEGDRLKSVLMDGSYKRFWDSTGLNNMTEKEINEKIDDVYTKAGVTQEILEGDEAEWIELSEKEFESVTSWKDKYAATTIVLPEPSWEFYYSGYEIEPNTRVYLEQKSKNANDITDTFEWFSRLGSTEPDRLSFSDDTYSYNLYGETSDNLKWYPYLMDICEKYSNEAEYTLDFSNYYMPDEYVEADARYVEESIHWAVADEGILYVSTYHNTYAQSAPHNGYITAFDMNDNFRVIWRSKPLTCNSNNFIITDDAIICGYGFTAEPDYVYVLDKYCGVICETYKVKTSPEWFRFNAAGELCVRCYDTDYVFEVKSH